MNTLDSSFSGSNNNKSLAVANGHRMSETASREVLGDVGENERTMKACSSNTPVIQNTVIEEQPSANQSAKFRWDSNHFVEQLTRSDTAVKKNTRPNTVFSKHHVISCKNYVKFEYCTVKLQITNIYFKQA